MTAKQTHPLKTDNLKEIGNLLVQANNQLQTRISGLLEQMGAGLHEREQVLAVSLLAALSGQNTFLYGPPGTAKSLISRRLSAAFHSDAYFEHLMNRFTTPEEVFGPVSIKELKEDRYIRKTGGYLPAAEFAFLDEIWKSSPAILNTLLTLINEHTFKNGERVEAAPLKSLIAASNEVPQDNQGLDALYDRFVVRLVVPPIEQEDNFNNLINSQPSTDTPDIDEPLLVSNDELDQWRKSIHEVKLSANCLLIIKMIRAELAAQFEELGVYVSDRRWQRAAQLIKASAFFNGRQETNQSDLVLLKHCLWTTPENQQPVQEIVLGAIKACGFSSGFDLAKLDREKDALDKEIHEELFHSRDVYDTIKLRGNENTQFFKVSAHFNYSRYEGKKVTCYIPYSDFKSRKDGKPVDEQGNLVDKIEFTFDGQGTCTLKYEDRYDKYDDFIFSPKVLFHKGDKKADINHRLIRSLAESVGDLRGEFKKVKSSIEKQMEQFKSHLYSPFITDQESNAAVQGIKAQLDALDLRIQDCERLEQLCR